MNAFLQSTKQHLAAHGSVETYIRVSAGVYDIAAGGAVDTSTEYSVLMYKQHIKASQYNQPHLIGKDAAMFIIAGDALGFTPKVKDKINFMSEVYTVDSYQSHIANGEICLFKLVALKG